MYKPTELKNEAKKSVKKVNKMKSSSKNFCVTSEPVSTSPWVDKMHVNREVRYLKTKFANAPYRYTRGMKLAYNMFNSLNELNIWYAYNILFVCKVDGDVDELDALYKKIANSFGYKVVYQTYVDYNGKDAAASLGQQTTPFSALMELYTNMVDAVKGKLMMECGMDYLRNPEYKKMKFKDILKDEKFSKINKLNLLGIDIEPASKTNNSLNYIFRDKGTGVESTEFVNTLLSTLAGNKKDLEFAQGRFNIGSAGVLPYCSKKFMLSRRSEIMGDSSGNYGFTTLRKGLLENPETDLVRWEYFMLEDKDGNRFIPFISNDVVFEYIYGSMGDTFEYGTIVKCFEISGVDGVSYSAASDFKEAFARKMVDPIIPGRLCHIGEIQNDNGVDVYINRNLCGRLSFTDYQLEKDSTSDFKDSVIYGRQVVTLPVKGFSNKYFKDGDVKIKVVFTAFTEKSLSLSKTYVGKTAVTYSLNGQVQAYETPSTLEHYVKLDGFSRILPYCMVDVIMDDVQPSLLFGEFFSSNREGLQDTVFKKKVRQTVCYFLKNNYLVHEMISNYGFADNAKSVDAQNLKSYLEKTFSSRLSRLNLISNGLIMESKAQSRKSKSTSKSKSTKTTFGVDDDKVPNKKSKICYLYQNRRNRFINFIDPRIDYKDKDKYEIHVSCGKYDISILNLESIKKFDSKFKDIPNYSDFEQFRVETYAPLNGSVSIVSKRNNKEQKNNLCVCVTLTPDFSMIGDYDLFFLHCDMVNKETGEKYYHSTALLAKDNKESLKGDACGNDSNRLNSSIDANFDATISYISRDGYRDMTSTIFSYSDVMGSPSILNLLGLDDNSTMDDLDDFLITAEVSNNKLTKFIVNLDSTYFKQYADKHKELSSNNISNKFIEVYYGGYLDAITSLVNDLKKSCSESNSQMEFGEKESERLKERISGIQSTVITCASSM